MWDGAGPYNHSSVPYRDHLDTIPPVPTMGHPLSPIRTTVASALIISTSSGYQAASDLLCLSVPDSPIIQEHSAAVVASAFAVSSALPVLVTKLSQLSAPYSTLTKMQSAEVRPASFLVLKDLLVQTLIFRSIIPSEYRPHLGGKIQSL